MIDLAAHVDVALRACTAGWRTACANEPPAGIPPVSCADSSDGQSARVLTGMSQVRSLLGTPAATQGAP